MTVDMDALGRALEDPLYEGGWCLRSTRRRHSWRHTSEGGFDARRYAVHRISEPDAKAFVLTHHYAGSYPAGRQQYGLFDGDRLVGAAVLGEPMHPKVITNPLPTLTSRTAAELSRLVLLDEVPANAESWFVARAFRLGVDAGLQGVVAFSDPMPRPQVGMPGHVGTVYQALNASYCKRATARTLTFLPDGTVFSDRSAQKIRRQEQGWAGQVRRLVTLGAAPPSEGAPDAAWLAGALASVGVRKVRHLGNHRFVFRLRRRTPLGMDTDDYPKTADPIPEEVTAA